MHHIHRVCINLGNVHVFSARDRTFYRIGRVKRHPSYDDGRVTRETYPKFSSEPDEAFLHPQVELASRTNRAKPWNGTEELINNEAWR